jgi:nucleoside-diphosphate-sugar epimerase
MANRLEYDLDYILAHTPGLWDDVRGQRIFITGGTGFFGCWLLESFTWANDRLGLGASAVVLTREPQAFHIKAPHLAAHPALQFHIGDVRTFDFPAGEFSHVIHAATETSATLATEDLLAMFDTIVAGTRRTLEFARQCGAEKFLLTSSGAVYGVQPPELTHIPEDYSGAPSPVDPDSAYGEGKRVAELLSIAYSQQYGFETKIARCFAFVGPYLPLDTRFAIGNFVRDGLQGGPIRVNGDGSPYRSYLYMADLAIWLWTILVRGTSCRPYNVGSDREVTISDLASVVARCFQPNPKIHIARQPAVGSLLDRYVPSVARAKAELDLEPRVDLQIAIERTIAWNAKVVQSHSNAIEVNP